MPTAGGIGFNFGSIGRIYVESGVGPGGGWFMTNSGTGIVDLDGQSDYVGMDLVNQRGTAYLDVTNTWGIAVPFSNQHCLSALIVNGGLVVFGTNTPAPITNGVNCGMNLEIYQGNGFNVNGGIVDMYGHNQTNGGRLLQFVNSPRAGDEQPAGQHVNHSELVVATSSEPSAATSRWSIPAVRPWAAPTCSMADWTSWPARH